MYVFHAQAIYLFHAYANETFKQETTQMYIVFCNILCQNPVTASYDKQTYQKRNQVSTSSVQYDIQT